MTAEVRDTEFHVTPSWADLVAICEENSARRWKRGYPDSSNISHSTGIRSVSIEDTELHVLYERILALQVWVTEHPEAPALADDEALDRMFEELRDHVSSFDPGPQWCSEITPPDEPPPARLPDSAFKGARI